MGNALRACHSAYFEDWWQERPGLARTAGVGQLRTTWNSSCVRPCAGAVRLSLPRLLLILHTCLPTLPISSYIPLSLHGDPPTSSTAHFTLPFCLLHLVPSRLPSATFSPCRLVVFVSSIPADVAFLCLARSWSLRRPSSTVTQPHSNNILPPIYRHVGLLLLQPPTTATPSPKPSPQLPIPQPSWPVPQSPTPTCRPQSPPAIPNPETCERGGSYRAPKLDSLQAEI